jgi:hypothetical protein
MPQCESRPLRVAPIVTAMDLFADGPEFMPPTWRLESRRLQLRIVASQRVARRERWPGAAWRHGRNCPRCSAADSWMHADGVVYARWHSGDIALKRRRLSRAIGLLAWSPPRVC